ncbi:hypothetical protein GOODEAATRI_026400, partial [Goodea atripinnis]
YRGRPTPAPVGGRQEKKKEEYNEAGGCTHASEAMIDDLSRSSNNVFNYVNGISSSLRERQLVFNNNNQVMRQYTDQVEEQHAYIKETVDTVFPSNIRILQGVLDKIRLKIQKLEKAITAQNDQCKDPCKTSCPIPVVSGKECEDIFRRGGRDSQMYVIQPDPLFPPYKVFCDQTTQNGGLMAALTLAAVGTNIAVVSETSLLSPANVSARLLVHAQYQRFTIQTETSNYVMAVDGYSGNAGNCFLEGALELFGENRTMTIHNGMMFSTYDRDNDNWNPGDPSKQCSREDGGGWWYNRCHSANPNGRYYMGGAYTAQMAKHGTDDGIVWMNWKGRWYSLKAISMKIRPYFASR